MIAICLMEINTPLGIVVQKKWAHTGPTPGRTDMTLEQTAVPVTARIGDAAQEFSAVTTQGPINFPATSPASG